MDAFQGFSEPSGLTRVAREDGIFEVWLLDLETSAPGADVLSQAEHDRANRFVQARDRSRFMLTRAALRRLLGEAICAAPDEIRFATGRNGKPYLEGRPGPEFNVSHAGSLALIGLAHGRAIGVDIEVQRDAMDELQLARTFFSDAEHRHLAALGKEEQLRAFYRIWTCKEAVLKAFGVGIGEHLQDFAVKLTADGFALHPRPGFAALDFSRVRAEPLEAPERYAAAFALAPLGA